jgi:hypothetical protein
MDINEELLGEGINCELGAMVPVNKDWSPEEVQKGFEEANAVAAKVRRAEILAWCYEKTNTKVLARTELNRIYLNLRHGKSEVESIRGIVSYPTWKKYKEENPELKEMVEAAVEYRLNKLQDKQMAIADQPDRSRVGETARDRLIVDVLDKAIEREGRLAERLGKQKTSGNVQIAVVIGKGEEKNVKVERIDNGV